MSERRACRRLAGLVVAILVGGTGTAVGGRPVEITAVAGPPTSAGQTLVVATTAGLLISRDGGASLAWVCDRAIGYGGDWDPRVAVTDVGAIYVTTYEGLRVSEDGCHFRRPEGPLGLDWVEDIYAARDGAVWAVTATSGRASDVYVDRGDGFVAAGVRDPVAWYKRVRVAPSDPRRVYVSGYRVAARARAPSGANNGGESREEADGGAESSADGEADGDADKRANRDRERDGPAVLVLRSDDGGVTWTRIAPRGLALGARPQLLIDQVAPDDPAVLYAHATGAAPGADGLYRSDDAGASFARIADGPIGSIAVRGDGAVFRASASGRSGSIAISIDRGQTWTAAPGPGCLTAAAGAVLGCRNPRAPTAAIARAAAPSGESDASDAPGHSGDRAVATWADIASLAAVSGPLACPCDTIQATACEDGVWPAVARQFGHPATRPGEPRCPAAAITAQRREPPVSGRRRRGIGGAWALALLLLAALVASGSIALVRRLRRGL